MFTINSYQTTSSLRQFKIDRTLDRIAKLEGKDDLTGRQTRALNRLNKKLDRIAPDDELIVSTDGKTIGFTLVDSLYDDIIDGSETMRFVIRGAEPNRSGQRTVLYLNHPEKTNEKYDMTENMTVRTTGINYNPTYQNMWVEVYADDVLAFSQPL